MLQYLKSVDRIYESDNSFNCLLKQKFQIIGDFVLQSVEYNYFRENIVFSAFF